MLNGDLIYNVHYKDANTILLKIREGTNQKFGLNIPFFLENYALNSFTASIRNKNVQIQFKLILLMFKWLYCYLQDFHLLSSQKCGGEGRGEKRGE